MLRYAQSDRGGHSAGAQDSSLTLGYRPHAVVWVRLYDTLRHRGKHLSQYLRLSPSWVNYSAYSTHKKVSNLHVSFLETSK